jgi:hypothetical protein
MATINLGAIKFNWQGAYAGGTAYAVDDVVSYNGSSYVCKLASTGNLPTNTTYWDQMSSAGTNGTDLTSTLTTQGDILYRDGSGLVRLGAGTSGQALITGGAGANPSWGDAGGGSLTFLGSTTVTTTDVSAISFDGLFTSAYTHYKFIYSIRGATNNTDTLVRIRQSNSDVTASNYWYAGMGMYRATGNTTANSQGDDGASFILISSTDNTNNVAYPTTGELILFNPLSTVVNKTITTTNLGYNSASTPSAVRIWTFGGQLVDTTAASGLSFLYDGGNIMGTVSLYGIKNS